MTESRKIKEVRIIYMNGEEIRLERRELLALIESSDILNTLELFVKAWRSRGNAEIHS